MTLPFLKAEWKELVVLNFEVAPEVLMPYLPRGLELDLWQGKALISLVAFRFIGTRVLGLKIPFHENFEELNLRFYVLRREGADVKRGVVFIKELVPRLAIAWVARTLYNENYFCVPMFHKRTEGGAGLEIEYSWKSGGCWQRLSAAVQGEAQPLTPGSQEEFILEHYWGYSRSVTGHTFEYRVSHTPWRAWTNPKIALSADLSLTYGENFAEYFKRGWCSAFLALGSPVQVFRGKRIAID